MAKQSAHERRIRAKLAEQQAEIERVKGEIATLERAMLDRRAQLAAEIETLHLLEELLDAPTVAEGEAE